MFLSFSLTPKKENLGKFQKLYILQISFITSLGGDGDTLQYIFQNIGCSIDLKLDFDILGNMKR